MRRAMALADLLPDLDVPRDIVVRGLVLDSRAVEPGDAFVASLEGVIELRGLITAI